MRLQVNSNLWQQIENDLWEEKNPFMEKYLTIFSILKNLQL